jgi:translation initiation factor 1
MALKNNPGATSLAHTPFAKLAELQTKPSENPSLEGSASSQVTAPEAIFGPKVVVRRERKGHGGKTATLVDGVVPAQRERLSGEMKKAFGCGARVEGESIVLQGDIADRACSWLEKRGAKRIVRGS